MTGCLAAGSAGGCGSGAHADGTSQRVWGASQRATSALNAIIHATQQSALLCPPTTSLNVARSRHVTTRQGGVTAGRRSVANVRALYRHGPSMNVQALVGSGKPSQSKGAIAQLRTKV